MHIPKSIVIAAVTGLIVLLACVAVSTAAINQCRIDRIFMQQHCTMNR